MWVGLLTQKIIKNKKQELLWRIGSSLEDVTHSFSFWIDYVHTPLKSMIKHTGTFRKLNTQELFIQAYRVTYFLWESGISQQLPVSELLGLSFPISSEEIPPKGNSSQLNNFSCNTNKDLTEAVMLLWSWKWLCRYCSFCVTLNFKNSRLKIASSGADVHT